MATKSKIDKTQLEKFRKASKRQDEIDSGFHLKPKHQVHKSPKDYTRKKKYKDNFITEE